jgi:hypothetical protein
VRDLKKELRPGLLADIASSSAFERNSDVYRQLSRKFLTPRSTVRVFVSASRICRKLLPEAMILEIPLSRLTTV